MINVSNEFKKLMNTRTDFKENAEITFANGTALELTENDFTVTNNNIVDASDTNGIPLGNAICRSVQIELMNDDDRFSEYDFLDARIRLYLTFQLSETIEKIEYGTFTVLTPETYGSTVIISALDDMHKADKDYYTSLPFPATVKSLLVDACNSVGISLGTTTFLNDNFVVQSAPADITFRQLIGYIAMIAGGNARIDVTGRLRIITYDFSVLDSIQSYIDGGHLKPWSEGNVLDGGTFNPWNNGDTADGGAFGDRNALHVLSNWKDLKVDTDDVVITGIQTTYTDSENEEHTAMYGVEGYLLNVENPLFIGQEDLAVGLIGNVMVGGRFRQFSGDLVANPIIEFMDVALVIDRKGNIYSSFVTDINFQFFGFTTLKNSAEPTLRNSAKTYSEATKTLVKARELVKNERKAREQAIEKLANDLKASSGLFMTEEEQLDGSVIYYMHDKLTLEESMIVWRLTALAFGISTDGGNTYPYGFTVDGETITRLLYAEGINADYIDTGALNITDTNGNKIFYADFVTGKVEINASSVMIGSSSIEQAINGIEIGGTNLLRHTKDFGSEWWGNSTNLGAVEDPFGGTDAYAFQGTAVDNSYLIQGNVIKRSGKYVASLWAKASQPYELFIGIYSFRIAKLSLTTEWQKFEVPFEVTDTSEEWWCFGSYGTWKDIETIIYLYHPKLEEGTLATDWSPSPKDIVSKGEVSAQISVEDGDISIRANRFSWEADNSSLTKDGLLTAKNAVIENGTLNFENDNGDSFVIKNTGIEGKSYSANQQYPYIKLYNNYASRLLEIDTGSIYWYYLDTSIPAYRTLAKITSTGVSQFAELNVDGEIYAQTLLVYGTKSRVADTDNYNKRLLYCYEMPTPYFGDIGEGKLDESGICYIYIDDVFFETIDTSCNYQVFLQKYGEGDLFVIERNKGYFVVKGTPNLPFAWEIKAKQSGYTMNRLDALDSEEDVDEIDYEAEANIYLTNYEKEIFNYA